MPLIQLPDRTLPAPRQAEMPPPVSLRRMLGPGIVLVGLSIGSGEFILWPRLTSEWGFALFWACWIGVTIQFFLNMEIGRYTLATGESAVTGFIRLWRGFGPVFLVCATLPWAWPGWATGAGTLLAWEFGGSVTLYAIAGLLLCGVVLSIGPVVYRTVEVIQIALVGMVFTLVLGLAWFVIRWDSVTALAAGSLRFGYVPEGMHLPLLLGALAFAGVGGTGNLAQSNYIKDKGYGMGRWIGRITSPLTGREEATSELGVVFEASDENLARWHVWWRRANLEHFFSFYLLCLFSLALFCLLTHSLLGDASSDSEGLGFIADQAAVLNERFGPLARHVFIGAGVCVLLSTEIGLLDSVARISVDVFAASFPRDGGWPLSKLYFAFLWGMIAFGVLVLSAGFSQPLQLLVLSASLNAVVMFLYSGLLIWLNTRSFEAPLRPSALRIGALALSFLFFGYFSIITIVDQLRKF